MTCALGCLDSATAGPPVLWGGSLGTSLAMWRAQEPLGDRLRTVRFDHRGHGRSPVPPRPWTIADMGRDVLALMDRLGLERASYVGLSIGGMVGIWLAAEAPDRIDRLVLCATTAWFPDTGTYAERARTVLEAGSTAPVRGVVEERWLTPAFVSAHPEVRDELVAQVLATPAEGYAGCCEAIVAMDLRAHLARIRAPTLVISGAEDVATPVAMQERLTAEIDGAVHHVVPGAHLVSVESPQPVNRLILEHLGLAAD